MFLQLFSARLKEVREQLLLTQDEMVLKTGIPKRSYCAYEAGDMAPSAKLLAALAEIGIDISYLLTGTRSSEAATLSGEEMALLDNYRHCPPEGKAALKTTSYALAQQNAQYDVKKAS